MNKIGIMEPRWILILLILSTFIRNVVGRLRSAVQLANGCPQCRSQPLAEKEHRFQMAFQSTAYDRLQVARQNGVCLLLLDGKQTRESHSKPCPQAIKGAFP